MSSKPRIASEDILAQKVGITKYWIVSMSSLMNSLFLHCYVQWDQTISNFVVKTGIGLSVGIVASALLFKSEPKIEWSDIEFHSYWPIVWFTERTWPIAISTGWGFGVAYADAQVNLVLDMVWTSVSQGSLYLFRNSSIRNMSQVLP